jgi:hypothetical protein
MLIYGIGSFKFPGTKRGVWDFEDGPLETSDPILVAEAKRRGYSFEAPSLEPVRRKPGRPAKADKPDEKKASK